MAKGIVVFGANGSGKTTLGRQLAKTLNFKHMDVEDYYFEKSDIFYSHPRSKDEVINLMLDDIEKYRDFVISGVTCDFGEKIAAMYSCAVFLSAPIELRMGRIRDRAIDKHGERAMPGGDIYEDRVKFIEYARTRDLSVIDKWAKTLTCPIIHLDATKPILENARAIVEFYLAL